MIPPLVPYYQMIPFLDVFSEPIRQVIRKTHKSLNFSIDLCYYFMACAQKARKKFNSNPLDELTEKQRRIYNELPITFSTAEGLEIATEYNIPERTFKEWLKSNFFRHVSHGQYEKRYK